jgi:O-antigen ligase
MGWFLVYATIFALNGILLSQEFLGEFLTVCFQLVQLAVLVWVASELLTEQKMARAVLVCFSFASSVVATGNLLQLPGFFLDFEGRATVPGDNPNGLAGNAAFAAAILTGLVLSSSIKHLASKVFLVFLTIPVLAFMVATGSRGGIVAFMMGSLVYLVPYRHSKRILISAVLAIVLISSTAYKIASTPEIMERWLHTYNEGSLAHREEIFPEALSMIWECPIFGWGPIAGQYGLAWRLGMRPPASEHNLWLALLLAVGIVGTIPFLIGFWLCGRSAWGARSGNFGLLPLALLLIAFGLGLSGTTLTSKAHWLVMALALASSSSPTTCPTYDESIARRSLMRVRGD